MTSNFTFVDLFAGIGGFRIALQNVGGHCLGFSEIAPDAIDTYCKNFDSARETNFGDIRKITEMPAHDFMTAGVPCQSWSIAGKNLGFDDNRGQLWNDTLYLLNKCRPQAFIFENVKGLSDPRNREALAYIMLKIKEAGYYAQKYVINACDYGVPQTRVRIYIVGFKNETYFKRFQLPHKIETQTRLSNILDDSINQPRQVFDTTQKQPLQSLSCNEQGFNDYFLFNDLRNGETTIHSWDIIETSERQKYICMLLLKNRRKPLYGDLDGNPLSLKHFQDLDKTITECELEQLANIGILKKIAYKYRVVNKDGYTTDNEKMILTLAEDGIVNIDSIKNNREIKIKKIIVNDELKKLADNNVIHCIEERYDFRNSKISTGLYGINRIFLPSSKIYPTLVASDTNDFVSTVDIKARTITEFRDKFMKEVYFPKKFRRISKKEACRVQGFPDNFLLPETRPKWMKLIGNSVSVPVVQVIAQSIVNTGVFC